MSRMTRVARTITVSTMAITIHWVRIEDVMLGWNWTMPELATSGARSQITCGAGSARLAPMPSAGNLNAPLSPGDGGTKMAARTSRTITAPRAVRIRFLFDFGAATSAVRSFVNARSTHRSAAPAALVEDSIVALAALCVIVHRGEEPADKQPDRPSPDPHPDEQADQDKDGDGPQIRARPIADTHARQEHPQQDEPDFREEGEMGHTAA